MAPSARDAQYRPVSKSDSSSGDSDEGLLDSSNSRSRGSDDSSDSGCDAKPGVQCCLGTWLVTSLATGAFFMLTYMFANVLGRLSAPWLPLVGSTGQKPVLRQLDSGPLAAPFGPEMCRKNKGPFEFQQVPMSAKPAKKAARSLLRLTKKRMKQCEPPVGTQVGQGGSHFSTTHKLLAAWKYSEDCESVTFRLKVLLPKKKKVWMGQGVFRMATKEFSLLEDAFDPPICELSNDGAGSASRVKDAAADPEVKESARFAVSELGFQREKQGCGGELSVALDKVIKASQQLSQKVAYILFLGLKVTDKGGAVRTEKACLTVYEDYTAQPPPRSLVTGIFGKKGNFSVCSDPSTWAACTKLVKPQARALGAVEDAAADATRRLVAQRQWRRARRRLQAQGIKAPIAPRYIPSGDVPESWDPRREACFAGIPVYDQGSCGCCYGAANAQMFSLRLCLLAKKGRRLQGCADDPVWRDLDGHDCVWYHTQSRCHSSDLGQLSHCRQSCGTCPQTAQARQEDASYEEYAYATEDVATCSCNNYNAEDSNVATNCQARAGCDGGTVYAVWDGWMRFANRKVKRRHCNPLTIKCMNSVGVTNPLSSSSCGAYSALSLWEKPCECIPSGDIPKTLPQCGVASDACALQPPPVNVYVLSGPNQGLSIANTVLNMKRNIVEAGPLYVTFMVSEGFMNFWNTPQGRSGGVYMGDDDADTGGHAVIIVGWGVSGTTPYWIIRNSWTDQWAEGGYGKFLQGQNVKGIEESAAVAMMGPHADFTPPSCAAETVTWTYMSFPSELCQMEMTVSVSCTEAATMQFSYSAGPPDAEEPSGAAASGQALSSGSFRCPDAGLCQVKGFDLLAAGFGLQDATLDLDIRSWDERGNVYTSQSSMLVSAVPGMTSKGKESSCGLPKFSCQGCVEPAWPEPSAPAG